MLAEAFNAVKPLWIASYQFPQTFRQGFFRFCYADLRRGYYSGILNYVRVPTELLARHGLGFGTGPSVGFDEEIPYTSIHRQHEFHSLGKLRRRRDQAHHEIALRREVVEVARMDVHRFCS